MFSKRSWRAFVCACVAGGVGGLSSCLDRPVTPSEPHTSNVFVDLTAQHGVDKIDLLFMIDNSRSMADKQEILGLAVPQLLRRLLNPLCRDSAGNTAQPEAGACPRDFRREYEPVDDIHIGVVSSSLGAPATQACASEYAPHGDDAGQLVGLSRTRADGTPLTTYQGLGFLAWDPKGKKAAAGLPPGEFDPEALIRDFQELVVATGESGCGYEASLEASYRFLVDPAPPARWVVEDNVARPDGVDLELLEQRRQFLRPDSLLAIVMLSDENDCSLDFKGDGWIFAYNGENTPGQSFQMLRHDTKNQETRHFSTPGVTRAFHPFRQSGEGSGEGCRWGGEDRCRRSGTGRRGRDGAWNRSQQQYTRWQGEVPGLQKAWALRSKSAGCL